MFWLPTMAAHITGIEDVRLAGKGFSTTNSQTNFGTLSHGMDEMIIIFLGYPLLFNTFVHFMRLTHLETTGPCFFCPKISFAAVRYGTAQLHYCRIILSCSHLVKITDSRISIILVCSE